MSEGLFLIFVGLFIAIMYGVAWFIHEVGHALTLKSFGKEYKLTWKGVVYYPEGMTSKQRIQVYLTGVILGLAPMFILIYSGLFTPLGSVVLLSLYLVGCVSDFWKIGNCLVSYNDHKTRNNVQWHE